MQIQIRIQIGTASAQIDIKFWVFALTHVKMHTNSETMCESSLVAIAHHKH